MKERPDWLYAVPDRCPTDEEVAADDFARENRTRITREAQMICNAAAKELTNRIGQETRVNMDIWITMPGGKQGLTTGVRMFEPPPGAEVDY